MKKRRTLAQDINKLKKRRGKLAKRRAKEYSQWVETRGWDGKSGRKALRRQGK